ncbi:MAG: SEC-C metal-binding domain-containing protein, partial [Moraxellaceae bacterium]|nr:SEC-C metal-binding domain-containing protein [Moraxellaceae bacterium]
MIDNEDRVPRNVIDECARRGDAMVEQLSGLVDDSRDWWIEPAGEWWLKLHAVMVLGLIPTESAGLLLVKFMRRMSREEDHDLQDWLASCWPALFQNKPESVLPALRALGEDRAVDWYIRTCAIEAVVAAARRQGSDTLESALEWLAGIVANEEEDWDLRLCSGNTLLDFPRIQHRPLLEDMAARQGFLGVHFTQDDVRQAYAAMQDKADWERSNDPWKFYLPSEIAARKQRWEKEDAKKDVGVWDGDYNYDYDKTFLPEPYVRAEQKIGRNDPCPCGSGKKYKKCCLDKDGAGDNIF